MDQEILYYLVFILQGMEMFGSILLARGRFVTVMSLIFAVIYSCSIYFYHRILVGFRMEVSLGTARNMRLL